ncbi:MAG TPA: DUF2892 domain-containing protein [Vicinamibacterales bacterium]|nr:DUF2892 domain-containing protein [Vicinamibacterales bacterium]
MKFANEGEWDRGVRMLSGVLLLYAGWSGVVPGALGIVLILVGVVALATGIVGWCPAYSLIGVSTRKEICSDTVRTAKTRHS